MQYETPGFLPNKRIHRAMGLAALEVMQAVQRTWTNSKVRMNGKTRLMQWRDMFDVAVKWRRIADPDQPVLWLDQMPARSLSRGFNNHINLIRGQVINMRYLEYFEKILHFIKDRILVYHGANNPKGLLEVREALEKVHRVEDLLPVMKFNTKTKDGFTVNTKVPSLKDQGKEYEGFTVTVTGDKVGNILFSVETQTTEERTQLYHAEIDALYKDLTAKGKVLILSSEFGEADAVCNLILSLVYYFYNLMPLSRGSSVIAYSVIVGALMASGKEVAGKIPKGKLVDFEAMTAPGSEAFSKIAKSWMNLKRVEKQSSEALPRKPFECPFALWLPLTDTHRVLSVKSWRLCVSDSVPGAPGCPHKDTEQKGDLRSAACSPEKAKATQRAPGQANQAQWRDPVQVRRVEARATCRVPLRGRGLIVYERSRPGTVRTPRSCHPSVSLIAGVLGARRVTTQAERPGAPWGEKSLLGPAVTTGVTTDNKP
ncbi:PREDICTED: tetratricopeptide repeat protein 13-like [Galeopterus variegatus]|uniref:Tetratricopeptide repeat protein 13-like n=1 Tax=Galeopterus variegatus TaxID=482537 RepID=A0ABM0SJ03_GALVR|nr:PREDICTED: tetratricopeptide repeat protein 13-like [Galeopterus variegatus]